MPRPTIYSGETAREILTRLASGESLRAICKSEHLPAESTVRLWVAENRDGFSAHYARARDIGLDCLADELLEIADDGTNDWMERIDGDGAGVGWVLNGEHVQRSRVRIDTRKWLLSKMAPKRYGDKQSFELSGPEGKPIETVAMSAEEAYKRLLDAS